MTDAAGIAALLAMAAAVLIAAASASDWVAVSASPPRARHIVRGFFGLWRGGLDVDFLMDPGRPFDKVPPPLRVRAALLPEMLLALEGAHAPLLQAADSAGGCVCGALVLLMCGGTAQLVGACLSWHRARLEPGRPTPRPGPCGLLAAALYAAAAGTALASLVLGSAQCPRHLRTAVSELLASGTFMADFGGGRAGPIAIWPAYVWIRPARGALLCACGAFASLAACLVIVGVPRVEEAAKSSSTLLRPDRKAALVQLVGQDVAEERLLLAELAMAQRELTREQRRWGDRFVGKSLLGFVALLYFGLWAVGGKAVDRGVKRALDGPARYRRRKDQPGRNQTWRETRRDLRASGIRTAIRTCIRIDDTRKAILAEVNATLSGVPRKPRRRGRPTVEDSVRGAMMGARQEANSAAGKAGRLFRRAAEALGLQRRRRRAGPGLRQRAGLALRGLMTGPEAVLRAVFHLPLGILGFPAALGDRLWELRVQLWGSRSQRPARRRKRWDAAVVPVPPPWQ